MQLSPAALTQTALSPAASTSSRLKNCMAKRERQVHGFKGFTVRCHGKGFPVSCDSLPCVMLPSNQKTKPTNKIQRKNNKTMHGVATAT